MCRHCCRCWWFNGERISMRVLGKKGKEGAAVEDFKEYQVSVCSGTASSEEGTDDK